MRLCLSLRVQFLKAALNCDASISRGAWEAFSRSGILAAGLLVNPSPNEQQVVSESISPDGTMDAKISLVANLDVRGSCGIGRKVFQILSDAQ